MELNLNLLGTWVLFKKRTKPDRANLVSKESTSKGRGEELGITSRE